jgi:hypothetical protein
MLLQCVVWIMSHDLTATWEYLCNLGHGVGKAEQGIIRRRRCLYYVLMSACLYDQL